MAEKTFLEIYEELNKLYNKQNILEESVQVVNTTSELTKQDIRIFITYSSLDLVQYLENHTSGSVRIVYDNLYSKAYIYGDGYKVMHPDLYDVMIEYVDIPNEGDEDDIGETGVGMLYIAKNSEDHEINTFRPNGGLAASLTTKYIYSIGTLFVDDKAAYEQSNLYRDLKQYLIDIKDFKG